MRHFKKEEFQCPCCIQNEMDPIFLSRLEALRDMFQGPLIVNSAYRCEAHNQKIGGYPNSQHLLGKAADISTDGMSSGKKHELMNLANRLGFGGIGVYPTFFHLDMRDEPKLWVL
jgi:zinc D-Ala-D-Ala carboxypeptidase